MWHAQLCYSVIRESLALGQPDRQVRKCCILEGEMVAYSDFVSLAYLCCGWRLCVQS